MFRKLVGLLMCGLVGLVFASDVFAATLNVCKSGCEYSTIQSGIDAAVTGDTVLVSSGTYNENIDFMGIQSQSGARNTIIDGSNPFDSSCGSVIIFASGEGNIDADPLFVGNGNYRIMFDSPCVDNGIYTSVVADADLRGEGSHVCSAGTQACNDYSGDDVELSYSIDNNSDDLEGKGCGEGWQGVVDDTRLTSDGDESWLSNLGLDSSGNVHVAWQDQRDGNREIYYTKLYSDGTTALYNTRLTSGNRPSLGVDNSGNVHIAWDDGRDGNDEIYYTKLYSDGTTAVDDTRLTSDSANSLEPSLGVDSAGGVHIAWVDQRDGNREIYYTKLYSDGTTEVDDTRLTSDSAWSVESSLGVDSSGNVHIVWDDNRGGSNKLYYTKLYSNGTTAVDDTQLTFDWAISLRPSLGVDKSSNVHIAWWDNRVGNPEIYYTKLYSDGTTAVDDTRLTFDSAWSFDPSLRMDNSGNVHIAWQDHRDGNPEIYYTQLYNDGTTALDDTRLTSDSAGISDIYYFPSLGVDDSGNVHIAWNDYRDGNAEIYYMQGKPSVSCSDGDDGGNDDDDGGGCFIATAAYGTPLAKEVRILSRFRDTYLLPNSIGRRLVSLYYKTSPPVANYIKGNAYLKATVRGILKPVVWLVETFFTEENNQEKEK